MLEGLGAEVVLIAQVDGSPGQVTGSDVNAAAQAACAIARARDGFYVDQFNAAEGIAAHETTTGPEILAQFGGDRKSTRLNSKSLMRISYAVFCLKKKKK